MIIVFLFGISENKNFFPLEKLGLIDKCLDKRFSMFC